MIGHQAPKSEGAWSWTRSLVRALLRCWPVLLVPSLLTALATGTGQGRDAIAATATQLAEFGPGYHAYAAQAFSTVMATLSALLLLGPRCGGLKADNYAAYFVPALIGLFTGYLPLIALEWKGFDGLRTNPWLELSRAMPPVLVIAARDGMPLIAQAYRLIRGREAQNASAAGREQPLVRQLLSLLRQLLSPFDPIRYSIYVVLIVGLSASAFFISSVRTLAVMAVVVFLIGDAALYPATRPAIPRERRWVLISCALYAFGGGLLVCLLVAYHPIDWVLKIGSYATLMVALNIWLGAGILIWQLRLVSASASAGFVIILIALVLSGPFGLGDIRVIPENGLPSPSTGLENYAKEWLKSRRADIDRVKTPDRYPIFLISADGGGIRAAWWSATLLGLIADQAPRFPKHIFAMSGVSGGSLGIATFALPQVQDVDETGRNSRCMRERRQRCAAAVLSADLLAPIVAAMLTVDLTRSIVENSIWPDFIRMSLPADRATALERALERVWMDHAGTRLFEESFTSLWDGKRRLAVPLLLLNTSDAVTGRRLVIAPVTTGENTVERGDLLPLLGTNGLRLSTAVVLSARFPGITPTGWIRSGNAKQGYAVVDGGFADNSGARSASEALVALRNAAAAEGIADRIQVVAVMIANDPLPAQPAPAVPAPGKRSGVSTIGSLIAPVMTLDHLRQTNTQEAKRIYAKEIGAGGGLVLDHFDLRAEKTAFPLGWMLASTTRAAMEEQQKKMLSDSESHLCRAIRLARGTGDVTRTNEAAACISAK